MREDVADSVPRGTPFGVVALDVFAVGPLVNRLQCNACNRCGLGSIYEIIIADRHEHRLHPVVTVRRGEVVELPAGFGISFEQRSAVSLQQPSSEVELRRVGLPRPHARHGHPRFEVTGPMFILVVLLS